MKDLFVPYEIAVMAKKKGFDETCFGLYNPIKELCFPQLNYGEWSSFATQDCKTWIINCPTHQQLIDWFREKHSIHINLIRYVGWYYELSKIDESIAENAYGLDNSDEGGQSNWTYYEALNKALEEAFNLI